MKYWKSAALCWIHHLDSPPDISVDDNQVFKRVIFPAAAALPAQTSVPSVPDGSQ